MRKEFLTWKGVIVPEKYILEFLWKMSQDEIIQALKEIEKTYVTAQELARKIDRNVRVIRDALNRLYRKGIVEYIFEKNRKLWKLKEREKFNYPKKSQES